TRFTPKKHSRQNSPYKHLLKPKAGGTAFVFGAMGEMIHTMLDVTIVYPDGRPGIWDYLCGRVRRIIVDVRTRKVPERFLGMDYQGNRQLRADFQRWVGDIWAEKDARIEALKAGA
ncbi:MAG: acyltransferase, partial [Marinobacter sp.]